MRDYKVSYMSVWVVRLVGSADKIKDTKGSESHELSDKIMTVHLVKSTDLEAARYTILSILPSHPCSQLHIFPSAPSSQTVPVRTLIKIWRTSDIFRKHNAGCISTVPTYFMQQTTYLHRSHFRTSPLYSSFAVIMAENLELKLCWY